MSFHNSRKKYDQSLSDAGWGHQKNAAFEAILWSLFFDVYIYVQKEAEILYTKNN